MASLYEIDERLRILEEYMVDEETGELLSEDEFYKKLDEVQMALSDKIENTMCFYKNLMSDIEAFKEEENKIAQRRKVKENLAERLKKRINDYVIYQHTNEDGVLDTEKLNKWKFETPKVKLSFRKSEKVEANIDLVPKKFIKKETKLSLDKTAIKEAIKGGLKVKGAQLVTNMNMQVK